MAGTSKGEGGAHDDAAAGGSGEAADVPAGGPGEAADVPTGGPGEAADVPAGGSGEAADVPAGGSGEAANVPAGGSGEAADVPAGGPGEAADVPAGGPGEGQDVPAGGPAPIEDAEVDARWASIVEQLGDVEQAAGAGPAPAGAPGPAPGPPPGPATPGHVVARARGPRDWPVTPEVEALEEAESHFAPPDPGPVITSRDPLATLAWAGAVGVPVLGVLALILVALLPALRLPGWVGPLGAVTFVASVAVLLWRMPPRRDPADDDDGAVV